MARYLAQRLASGLVALFLFLTMVFFMSQVLVQGDFVNANMPFATKAEKDAMRDQLGLDNPLSVRYVSWLRDLASGDLGNSFYGYPVLPSLLGSLPFTLLMLVPAVSIAFLFGVFLGKVAAWRGPGILTDSMTFLAVVFYAFFPPALVFALYRFLLPEAHISNSDVIFGVFIQRLGETGIPNVQMQVLWTLLGAIGVTLLLNAVARRVLRRPLPVLAAWLLASVVWIGSWFAIGIGADSLVLLQLLLAPLLAFTLLTMGDIVIVTRASVTDSIHDQYVWTAEAKGLPDRVVRDRHATRTAMLPIASRMVVSIPYLLAGMVIIESAAEWPGLGSMLFRAAMGRDVPMMMAALMLVGVITLLARLFLDVLLVVLDPRLRTA